VRVLPAEVKMVEPEVNVEKEFDIGLLNEKQVETLKVAYQDISFKSIGLIKCPVKSGQMVYYGNGSFHTPTKRRTAIAQWYDPQTDNEIVFYPQGSVLSYITKRSGHTNKYLDVDYQNTPLLSDMMKKVLGRIVTSRTIKNRRELLSSTLFLERICGGKDEFEKLLMTDEEANIVSKMYHFNPVLLSKLKREKLHEIRENNS